MSVPMTPSRSPIAVVLFASLATGGLRVEAQTEPPWRCPAPSSLESSQAVATSEPAPAPTPSRPPEVEITSDNAIVGLDGDAQLLGNVELRQGERRLSAQEVEYDAQTRQFRARGTVRYSDDSLQVEGRGGRYDPAGGLRLEQTTFELPARPARGAAEALEVREDGRAALSGVWFSTCPAQAIAWRIRARDIELDPRRRNGSARHASIEFQGVPILYLPYLSFPIGSQRKSGFLFPGLGYSTRAGIELTVPYYINLAPQYDLTLQPKTYGERGAEMGAGFRYLAKHSRGEMRLNYLPNDRVRRRDRDWLRWQHRSELPAGWRVDFNAESVSDAEYFEDFSAGADSTSTAFLQRTARLSYRDVDWRLLAEVQHLQTLDRALTELDRPYARLPRIAVSGEPLRGTRQPWLLGLDAEVVNFGRDIGVRGWRSDLAPRLGLNLEGRGWYARPLAGYRYTRYELSGTDSGVDTSPVRSLPFAALDAGLLLERAPLASRTRITLEPRMLYLWTPYRDQSALPIFDTALPDLDFVQLFRTERYVGADRVADANQLSVGATARLYDADSGRQRLSATLGQIRYFDTPRVRLPDERLTGREESDLVAQLSVGAWSHWNVDLGTQWNTSEGRQSRSQLRLAYRPDKERALNLAYRYQRDRLEQAELSGAWPIGSRWNTFARLVYDLDTRGSLDRFVGLEYKACCWRLRLVGRRYLSSRTGEQDSGVYLQLELNGLASVGSRADAFLETAIRGYSASSVSR